MDYLELDKRLIEDKSIVDKKIKWLCSGIIVIYLMLIGFCFLITYLKNGAFEDIWSFIFALMNL